MPGDTIRRNSTSTRSGKKSSDYADKHRAAHNDRRGGSDRLWYNTPPFTESHSDNLFLFGETDKAKNSRHKHTEGAIQKAATPNCICAACRRKTGAARPANRDAANEPAIVSTRAA